MTDQFKDPINPYEMLGEIDDIKIRLKLLEGLSPKNWLIAMEALEILADRESWSGKEQDAILYGHFTAREVAERALKEIRGEEVEP